MIFGVVFLMIIYLLWVLVVQGALWKIIVGFFGWLGMHSALMIYFPESSHICITISGSSFTWAQVIPTIVVFLATAYTKE
jgi:hypothetical protein